MTVSDILINEVLRVLETAPFFNFPHSKIVGINIEDKDYQTKQPDMPSQYIEYINCKSLD